MAQNLLREILVGRLASRAFVVPFILVTLLCMIDLAAMNMGGSRMLSLIPYGYAISYGTVLSLYVVCIIESFGISIMTRVAASAWTRLKSCNKI